MARKKPAAPSADPAGPGGRDPIADALRQLYDSTVAEPVPDDFLRILDRLAAEEEQDRPAPHKGRQP